jgi:hypothetical protein
MVANPLLRRSPWRSNGDASGDVPFRHNGKQGSAYGRGCAEKNMVKICIVPCAMRRLCQSGIIASNAVGCLQPGFCCRDGQSAIGRHAPKVAVFIKREG